MIPMCRSVCLFVALFCLQLPVWSAITVQPWVPAYAGVDYASGEADSNEPRMQKVFAYRIDLQHPAIEMFSTPAGGPYETFGQTTTTFVSAYGVKIGINANFFSPVSVTPDDPRHLIGLAISQGNLVSPPENNRPNLVITSNNVASILAGNASFNPADFWTGVAGSDRVLINGVVQTFSSTDFTTGNHPRTAVGISQDERYLIMMVIDGRQPGYSDGAPLVDVADWLVRFGAYNGLNLDGGGSTTMVRVQGTNPVIVNRPSGGIQRVNGNHLGVFTTNIPPVFVTPPQDQWVIEGGTITLTSLAGGTAPLAYQWQFNGMNIGGATRSTLMITNAQLTHSGTYTLRVTNEVGDLSADATVSVGYELIINSTLGGIITKSPDTRSHEPNSTVTLTAFPDPGFVFTGWSGDVVGTNNPVMLSMDGHKSVTATFSGFPTDIVIDNPQATFSGTWSTASAAINKYGSNYRTASTFNQKSATYRPTIHTPGRYATYVWYPTESSRSTNAPWTISHATGTDTRGINQNINGGRWNLLFPGRDFARGTSGFVVLSNAADARVIADAVRFVYGFPPEITAQPSELAVVTGQSATLQVEATGTGWLFYQWHRDGNAVPSATKSSLTIHNAQPAAAGIYSVTITNLFGEAISVDAPLVVNVPPSIQAQPESMAVNQGANIAFSVGASGTDPLIYQWRLDDAPIPGATRSSYAITNVQLSHAGVYSVLVTNVAGALLSSEATLTVDPAPVAPFITLSPQSQPVVHGRTLSLHAAANGTLPMHFQWHFNGVPIPNATGSSLVIHNMQLPQDGSYTFTASNHVGTITSTPANVAIHYSLDALPTVGGGIVKSPDQPSYPPGSSVTLSALPEPHFAFAGWNGATVSTNNPLTVTMISNVIMRAEFTGSVQEIIMDNPEAFYVGTWTVGTSANGRYGADYHFEGSETNATSTATYYPNIQTAGRYNVYVWYPQGSNRASNAPWTVVSADGEQTTLVNQMIGGGSWQLIASAREFATGTNGYIQLSNLANNNVVIADAIRLAFVPPPVIAGHPVGGTIPAGAGVSFAVTASGSSLSYQWFFNNAAIPGAQGSSYSIIEARPSDSGSYTVAVTGEGGTVYSSPALLDVYDVRPARFETITVEPTRIRFMIDGNANVTYQIQSSSDLVEWTTITNVPGNAGFFEFAEDDLSEERRFYRLVQRTP